MENKPAARALLAIASALILALFTGPAFAHHADDHEWGPPEESSSAEASSEESSSTEASSEEPSSRRTSSREGGVSGNDYPVTEDNDDDGVANAPDPLGDTDNAHPSGKDKHVEAGGSGNQGRTPADPDDDGRGPERSNGGVDQPGGEGGVDLLDQDGNNGCGNDDDFEDDSEGKCLGPQPPTITECPPGGCPPPCPPNNCPNPPIIAAVAPGPPPEGPVGPTGAPGGPDEEVAPPPVPVPTPELAFTGANVGFLFRGMLLMAFAGVLFATLGEGRREAER